MQDLIMFISCLSLILALSAWISQKKTSQNLAKVAKAHNDLVRVITIQSLMNDLISGKGEEQGGDNETD